MSKEKFQDIRDMNKIFLVRDQNKVDSMAGVNAYHFDQNVSRNEVGRMIILHEYLLSNVNLLLKLFFCLLITAGNNLLHRICCKIIIKMLYTLHLAVYFILS